MEEDILMTPMGFLMLEHRLIERMVDLMEMELERIDRGKKVDIIFIDGAIDFAKTYADVCHHGKEEGIFFDKLAIKRLMPEHKDLMDELVLDHIQSRKIVVNLEMARERHLKGEPDTVEPILIICRSLTEFYPGHMEKEEKGFFPASMEYFSKREQEEMVKKFWEFDKDLLLAKYLKFMDQHERVG
ncbi:MAG: hemerythrin domain-containing protein [Thermodesulfobacteriota bacterium]|jgi:hemerythrin-like domain-containing protein